MNISQAGNHDLDQSQQFYRQYGTNALLPEIQWTELFKYSINMEPMPYYPKFNGLNYLNTAS